MNKLDYKTATPRSREATERAMLTIAWAVAAAAAVLVACLIRTTG